MKNEILDLCRRMTTQNRVKRTKENLLEIEVFGFFLIEELEGQLFPYNNSNSIYLLETINSSKGNIKVIHGTNSNKVVRNQLPDLGPIITTSLVHVGVSHFNNLLHQINTGTMNGSLIQIFIHLESLYSIVLVIPQQSSSPSFSPSHILYSNISNLFPLVYYYSLAQPHQ